MCVIPIRVNESGVCTQEGADPFVGNKGEFFSRLYNYLVRVLACERIAVPFPQR